MTRALFRYTARSIEGEVVRGSLEASSVEDVLAALRTRALFVTRVDRESRWLRPAGRAIGAPRRRALLAFFRSFATLIRAGVPIRRSLEVTIERTDDRVLREALRSILADVEHGNPLSEAMAKRPRAFSALAIAMIGAGEAAGILDDVLERLASVVERDAELRKKVRAALAYPTIVLIAASVLTVFLLARIVPMFAQMFDAFHVELPVTTRLLLTVGAAVSAPAAWIVACAAAAGIFTTIVSLARTARGALVLDRVRLRLPVVGSLLHTSITARTTRMLATLLRSGIELVTAIAIVRPVTGSPVYAAALAHVDAALREGDPLTTPLAAAGFLDPLAIAMIGIGEETGQLDEMLLKIASYFESDVEAAIATLGAVIEPALIAALGLVVGFIVFSVFIPLYTLIGSVSK
ncbi:MAG TPA: type II secretion system F family protein [Candidatus Limnocylindria bacterium]|jgi:type IV pilus assembly protein PilC|nr:type II secretion system F family protein [Candidatus Limnocylindria bacterium]